MLRKSRQQEIMNMLNTTGYVEISALCRIFSVTEMTIRRDLDMLAENGDIERTRGGAVVSDNMLYFEPRFERRMDLNYNKKNAIANEALKYISNGNTVYIDSGSTSFALAQLIPNDLHILAITNALNIGSELAHRTHISTIMIGGEISRNTLSARGSLSEEMLKLFRFDVAFIGANAIELNGNIYAANVNETGLKKAVIHAAKKTYLLADSTKIDSSKIIMYANLRDIEGLITDCQISDRDCKALSDIGSNVIIAGAE